MSQVSYDETERTVTDSILGDRYQESLITRDSESHHRPECKTCLEPAVKHFRKAVEAAEAQGSIFGALPAEVT